MLDWRLVNVVSEQEFFPFLFGRSHHASDYECKKVLIAATAAAAEDEHSLLEWTPESVDHLQEFHILEGGRSPSLNMCFLTSTIPIWITLSSNAMCRFYPGRSLGQSCSSTHGSVLRTTMAWMDEMA